MRKIVILSFIVIVAMGVVVVGGSDRVSAKPDPKQIQAERVKRGQYLVTIGGCNDCHTPFKMGPNGPEPDMSRALSGHPEGLVMPPAPKMGDGPWVWAGAGTNTAFAGPWGVSYARNLTPEKLTGTGIWTEEMFIQTLRTGKHWGVSRPILPPMPWQNYAQATDEDLKSIYAYLRTVQPIKNQVPDAVLAAPPSQVASASALP
ncbi:MAG TPA: diheme cytochrome c-553 [Thermoanaerobaculia bacterium]|nr:diheme cytochrome c-553 [Thermoanaerobaculia bacterium]